MDDLLSIYIEDMKEFLGVLYDSLLLLEKNSEDRTAVNEIFRAFHTMKSSTAAMDFKKAAHFIHCMEDLLQEIREGRIKVTAKVEGMLLKSYDLLEEFIQHVIEDGTEGNVDSTELLDQVKSIIQTEKANLEGKVNEKSVLNEDDMSVLKQLTSQGNAAYKMEVRINEDCVFKSVRAWMILEEVSKIASIVHSEPAKPGPEDFRNGTFLFDDTLVRAVIVSGMTPEDIKEELESVLNEIHSIQIEPFCPDSDQELLTYSNDDEKDVSDIVNRIIDDKEDKPEMKGVESQPNMQEHLKADVKNQAYIRIPAHKVDSLVNLLGELQITQSLHKQEISAFLATDQTAGNNLLRMERITKDMQDISMSLRMVSLKQTFQKIYRIGRDTSMELGKNVNITMSGEDTEIDRSVVEKILNPLMHLIRNSISHGIEEEAVRIAAGKSPQGNVSIQAYNRRGNIYIEISDDGRGLSKDKIYQKALEKGLIDASQKFSDDEIIRFIYLPGFSTEENINDISGRGVGMNIVETEIVKLGGRIDIVNREGIGCTFILKIPVNMATINGTIADIYGSNYVIPTLNIKQILKPEADQWVSLKGKRVMIKIRNDIIQLIPIDDILGLSGGHNDDESCMIAVVEHEQKLMALPVKSILGKQEIVVKSIGSYFRNLSFVSGATILGDGRVSLILDVEALFKMSEEMDFYRKE